MCPTIKKLCQGHVAAEPCFGDSCVPLGVSSRWLRPLSFLSERSQFRVETSCKARTSSRAAGGEVGLLPSSGQPAGATGVDTLGADPDHACRAHLPPLRTSLPESRHLCMLPLLGHTLLRICFLVFRVGLLRACCSTGLRSLGASLPTLLPSASRAGFYRAFGLSLAARVGRARGSFGAFLLSTLHLPQDRPPRPAHALFPLPVPFPGCFQRRPLHSCMCTSFVGRAVPWSLSL